MPTIRTDGAPFFVHRDLSLDVGHMPDGFEDWLATWNNVNDGYVRVWLNDFEEDEDLAALPQSADWVKRFRAKYPGAESILVNVDY